MRGEPCKTCGSQEYDELGFCTNGHPREDAPVRERSTALIEGQQLGRALAEASAAVDKASTAQEREEALETWEKRAIKLYESGYKFVTLIGFSMAGKSFFVNRVRRELGSRRGWNVEPREQESIPKTDQKIEVTQIVRQGTPTVRRVIADCDGEAYKNSVNALMKGDGGGEFAGDLRRYVTMTMFASAYILMIPADLTFEKRDDDVAGRFGLIVRTILALHRRLREVGDVRRVMEEGLRQDFVEQAIEHEFSSDRPMLVLFSQADRFPDVAPHTADPVMYAMTHARTLFRTIDNRFDRYRFDFVSAFTGHSTNDAGDNAAVDYDLPHSGAVEAFDWIDNMIEPRAWNSTTRRAIQIRRLVDRKFGRKYKEITQ